MTSILTIFTENKGVAQKQLPIIACLLLLITTASLACRLFSSGAAPASGGTVLFQDDFSDVNSGWNRAAADSGITDYTDGVYRILVNAIHMDIWAKPGLHLGDVSIEVDAIKIGGERNNRLGILCRLTQDNRFYTFIISSDGYYGIGKVAGGDYELIGSDSLQFSDAIQTGSALNHMRADCIGETLTLFVNDHQIAKVKDASLTAGDVGLIAGTYNTPGTDIYFDNFIVRGP